MSARTSLITAVSAIALLSGCAASDDTAGRFFVQPDKYVLYSCKELAEATQNVAARQLELEKLMARAETDSSGRLMSDLAYRPEYSQLRGQMNELRRTSAEKNCKFTPTGAGGAGVSDHVIR
ncbi:MAG TPA: twin-arginine translocation pathway signal [Pseudolabrys sp.]|jgi:hypothetical protein